MDIETPLDDAIVLASGPDRTPITDEAERLMVWAMTLDRLEANGADPDTIAAGRARLSVAREALKRRIQ